MAIFATTPWYFQAFENNTFRKLSSISEVQFQGLYFFCFHVDMTWCSHVDVPMGWDTAETLSTSFTMICHQVKSLSRVWLCDPMDCSSPSSSIHGIFQARVLEWVAISFSRGSSWPRDRTQVSCIAGWRFTIWATREAHISSKSCKIPVEENMK